MSKKLIKTLLPILDFLVTPLVFVAALILRFVRRVGVNNMNLSLRILDFVGILPVRDHYYEPLTNPKNLRHSLRDDRELPGIDMNIPGQLELLSSFCYSDELVELSQKQITKHSFDFNNPSFLSGDAEYLYNIIRYYKPRKIIEIGSGYSTLMASQAILKNKQDYENYDCKHICVEPYEMDWLEKLENLEVIRKLVEKTDIQLYEDLCENDILFIDSSHIIRYEFLQILPILSSGVIVHIHDIFTPKDYLDEWLIRQRKLWNEQYLLEAFLSCNKQYKVIGALNFLKHHYPDKLSEKCPILAKQLIEREPGSFWIKKV